MVLRVESLSFAYGKRTILSDVSFALDQGQWLTIVGPNGAGKTTLLRCLLGLLRPERGEVTVAGRSLAAMSPRDIARLMALLPQQAEMPFGFSVREIVAMGRTPHLGRFQPMTTQDHELVDQALRDTETTDLADRPVTALSGGETQRVFLARAFAQNTPLLILDEPTTNLDLFHERTLLDQVHARQQKDTAILAVLHDLNLAARYSDLILVLSAGRVVAIGPPQTILTTERIQSVFRVETKIWQDPNSHQISIIT